MNTETHTVIFAGLELRDFPADTTLKALEVTQALEIEWHHENQHESDGCWNLVVPNELAKRLQEEGWLELREGDAALYAEMP